MAPVLDKAIEKQYTLVQSSVTDECKYSNGTDSRFADGYPLPVRHCDKIAVPDYIISCLPGCFYLAVHT